MVARTYLLRIQNGSDQSISSKSCDNPPAEVITTGFDTYTARFENVKWCKRRTVRAISWGLNGCTILLRTQHGSDQSISSKGCDNRPIEVTASGFVTYTARFENVKWCIRRTVRAISWSLNGQHIFHVYRMALTKAYQVWAATTGRPK